jgi:serine/threonine-protein kinase RsbW
MENIKDIIKLKIPAKGEYLSLIRLTASSVAAKMGFNIDDIDDIKVSTGEACTSIIESLNPGEESEFKIEYIVTEDKLKIKIKNKIKSKSEESIEISEEEREILELSDLLEDGLGIMIIQSLMDEVNISGAGEGETEIKMIKLKRDE